MLTMFKQDKLRIGQARALIRPATGTRFGVAKIELTGLLDLSTLVRVQAELAQRTQDLPAAIVRADQAIITAGMNHDDLDPGRHEMLVKIPVALVAHPHQLPDQDRFLAKMARAGIMRAVFSPSQLPFARRWAEFHALARIEGSLL